MCLRLHGLDRIRTVADPFLGRGSTAVARVQLGVGFIGTELDAGTWNVQPSELAPPSTPPPS